MTELNLKKMALAFGLFSFGLMVFGSILSGASIITAFVRGTEAAVLFGFLVLGLGAMLVEKDDFLADVKAPPHDEDKGKNVDETT